jgi:hypothetical protein
MEHGQTSLPSLGQVFIVMATTNSPAYYSRPLKEKKFYKTSILLTLLRMTNTDNAGKINLCSML